MWSGPMAMSAPYTHTHTHTHSLSLSLSKLYADIIRCPERDSNVPQYSLRIPEVKINQMQV